jgi:hypothetical protein
LVDDLVVDRHVGEPLDGNARAFAHPLSERDATTRHIRTDRRRSAAFEIGVQLVEQGTRSSV